MTPAEIRCHYEAALRGWSSESVKDCYEKGVKASFAQWGAAGAEAYLESDRKPSDYVDAFKAANNVKAVNTLTPKWDDASGNEDKLGRIITQKWLAMFLKEKLRQNGRTGYPSCRYWSSQK